MEEKKANEWFSMVKLVVREPLKFKAKLDIGEDAYKSLRMKKVAWEIWDTAGVAGTPAALVKMFGLSATPIGWLILAGGITGVSWLFFTRYLKSLDGSKVTVIPTIINTHLDVLAIGLFDLIAPLALKVANADGKIDDEEREFIRTYFVSTWGYDQDFVCEGIKLVESKLADFKVKNLSENLAKFLSENPDCNYKSITKEILTFLNSVSKSDGQVDESEFFAIEGVKKIFDEVDKIRVWKIFSGVKGAVAKTVGETIGKVSDLTSNACDVVKAQGGKVADNIVLQTKRITKKRDNFCG